MTLRMLEVAHPLIRAFTLAFCLTPAIFGQSTTTLVTNTGLAEARYAYNKRVLAGTTVTEGPVAGVSPCNTVADGCKVLVIDNISLQVGGSGAQTYLVELVVNPNSSSPLIYYFLLSPTTTFAGAVPIGVLNQSTKIRLGPGDSLVMKFNGNPSVPATVDGVISGYTAPYATSQPL